MTMRTPSAARSQRQATRRATASSRAAFSAWYASWWVRSCGGTKAWRRRGVSWALIWAVVRVLLHSPCCQPHLGIRNVLSSVHISPLRLTTHTCFDELTLTQPHPHQRALIRVCSYGHFRHFSCVHTRLCLCYDVRCAFQFSIYTCTCTCTQYMHLLSTTTRSWALTVP